MSTSYHPPEASGRTASAGSVPPPEPLGGFEERLLADLKVAVAEQAAAWSADDAVSVERPARRVRRVRQAPRPGFWPVRKLVMAGAASAVVAVAVAFALTATSSTAPGGQPVGGHPTTGTPAGGPASSWPNTAAAGVLHDAALAALEVPATAPRPGQFVYTKLKRHQPQAVGGGSGVLETWLSADGVQAGLISGERPRPPATPRGAAMAGTTTRTSRITISDATRLRTQPISPTCPPAPRRCAPGCSGTLAVGPATRAACLPTSSS